MTLAAPLDHQAAAGGAPPAGTPAAAPSGAAAPTRWAPIEWVVLLGSLAWVLAVLAVVWPAPWHESVRSIGAVDAAAFALAGDIIRHGGIPYVGYWDHKPPLIHLLNAAGLALAGGRVWGIWLLSLVGFLTGLVLCYAVTRRLLGVAAAILATLYLAFSLPNLLSANLPGGYALPLQWGAVAVLAAWSARDHRSLRAGAWLGLLTTALALLKPNQIGAGVSVAVAIATAVVARRRWRDLASFVLAGVGATLAVVAVTAGYLMHEHALAAFSDQVLRYNAEYASLTTQTQRLRSAVSGLLVASQSGSALLPAAGWLLAVVRLWSRRRSLGDSAALVFAVVWLPVELALAAASGRLFPNYYSMLLAPLAYLAGVLTAEVAGAMASSGPASPERRWPAAILAAVSLALVGSAASATALRVRDDNRTLRRVAVVDSAVAYIRAHTAERDPIFVWGHAPDLYLLSGRRPASHFIYPLPLLTPGYADSALVRGFMDELRAASPPLIIGVSGNELDGESITPPLDHWDPDWRVPTAGPPDFWRAAPWWTMTPALKEFYDYVAQNYTLAGHLGGRWPVYRRVTPPSRAAADSPPRADARQHRRRV